MDSLSVGIPSPPSIATGERWSQVNTDLRNDLRSRRPSLPPGGGRDQIGRVAAIRSVGWPPSGWNTWPPLIGIHKWVGLSFSTDRKPLVRLAFFEAQAVVALQIAIGLVYARLFKELRMR